jgi:hypothetical protein
LSPTQSHKKNGDSKDRNTLHKFSLEIVVVERFLFNGAFRLLAGFSQKLAIRQFAG